MFDEDKVNESYQHEIQALENVKEQSNGVLIPDALEESILKGLAQGIKSRKANTFRKRSAFVTCFLLIIFLTSIRVSPTLASALQQIPGLGYIVELINYDKGLRSAVENDLMLPIKVSDEHENILFTVDAIIMDESSLIIFYTIENKGGHDILELSRPELSDEKGVQLAAFLSYGSSGNPDPDGDGKIHEKINVNFNEETILSNQLNLKVRLREQNNQEPSIQSSVNASLGEKEACWEVKIPIDKEKFAGMKTEYEINQTVEIEGQKMTFERMTIYPTRTILNVAYDPTNTKEIFSFDDLILLNEKGEEWGRIVNGVSSTELDVNREALYFVSNYFSEPKEITLQGKSLRALDKDKAKVVFDLEQGRILESPPNLALEQVIQSPTGQYELFFLLKTHPEYDENRGYSIFNSQFTDASEKSFKTGNHVTMTHTGKDEYDQTLSVILPGNETYQSPVTFQLNDYPSRIFGEINLRIK